MGAVIRPATAEDWPFIVTLLTESGLPVDGAKVHPDSGVVAIHSESLSGTGGPDIHGDVALLRSVAVTPDRRQRGLGSQLHDALIALAQDRGVSSLHLPTTPAAADFVRLGFSREARESAPGTLLASAEFNDACPASATLMVRPV